MNGELPSWEYLLGGAAAALGRSPECTRDAPQLLPRDGHGAPAGMPLDPFPGLRQLAGGGRPVPAGRTTREAAWRTIGSATRTTGGRWRRTARRVGAANIDPESLGTLGHRVTHERDEHRQGQQHHRQRHPLPGLAQNLVTDPAQTQLKWSKAPCRFCGVGCGQVVSARAGKVIHIEGDPGHPISEGTLCSKGAAGIQVGTLFAFCEESGVETSLRGRVLPIGGLKEKVLAAHRAGIKKVLIPAENEKDIEEIPAAVLKTVELELVAHMDDVLKKALVIDNPENLFKRPPVTIESKEGPAPFGEKIEDNAPAEILPQ